jgi:hypothetical protein
MSNAEKTASGCYSHEIVGKLHLVVEPQTKRSAADNEEEDDNAPRVILDESHHKTERFVLTRASTFAASRRYPPAHMTQR